MKIRHIIKTMVPKLHPCVIAIDATRAISVPHFNSKYNKIMFFFVSQMEKVVFENTHLALKAVLEVTPLASRQAVLQYAKECLPYAMTTDTRAHTKYIENLMKLAGYLKSDRRALLRIVIGRLVELDSHLPHQV